MSIDLSTLSYSDIQKLQKDLDGALKDRHTQAIKEAREEINSVAKKYGVTLDEILAKSGTKTERKTVAPKYRNHENPAETWTGRGKKPLWFVKAIQSGKSVESLLI